MTAGAPEVTVAIATQNRRTMVAELLDSLSTQTLPRDRFEVVVVDDGSTDGTPELLAEYEARGELDLRVIRRERSEGPAVARNDAWRAGRAPVVAFTDDDCVATPGWLALGLAACRAHPGAIVQGRTEPRPDQIDQLSPFSRTQVIRDAGPPYETCNIFYPHELLERVDGFAGDVFPLPGGEDTDLAWRALATGARSAYAPDALVNHAVISTGAAGMIRHALRWERTIPVYARHPGLRRQQLHRGVFWSAKHEHLLRFLLAAALFRRSRLAAALLARPYLVYAVGRRSGPLLLPYLLVHDLVELYAIVRGAIRNRVLVL